MMHDLPMIYLFKIVVEEVFHRKLFDSLAAAGVFPPHRPASSRIAAH